MGIPLGHNRNNAGGTFAKWMCGSSLIPRPPGNETVPHDVLYAHMQGHPGAKGDPGVRGTIGERVSRLFPRFHQLFPNSQHSPLLHRVDRETKVFRDIQGSLDTR